MNFYRFAIGKDYYWVSRFQPEEEEEEEEEEEGEEEEEEEEGEEEEGKKEEGEEEEEGEGEEGEMEKEEEEEQVMGRNEEEEEEDKEEEEEEDEEEEEEEDEVGDADEGGDETLSGLPESHEGTRPELEMAGVHVPVMAVQVEAPQTDLDGLEVCMARLSAQYGYHDDQTIMDHCS